MQIPLPISQKTQRIRTAQTKLLMLFRKIIAVHCAKQTKYLNRFCGINVGNFAVEGRWYDIVSTVN